VFQALPVELSVELPIKLIGIWSKLLTIIPSIWEIEKGTIGNIKTKLIEFFDPITWP